jgi:hypothetical protein
MSDCFVTRERMPLLLTESLEYDSRERAHAHIESCSACQAEWHAARDTWALLAEVADVEVPAHVRGRFLSAIAPEQERSNVSFFSFRRPLRRLAEAAVVVLLVGGSYYAGHRARPMTISPTGATLNSVIPVSAPAPFSIAESRVLPANQINPDIQGRPEIDNVRFVDDNPNDNEVAVSFDMKSHVTITGQPTDKSMVRVLTYVMENEDRPGPSRSRAIDWVRQTYMQGGAANPDIAKALANVLRNDTHEGVRIKAADTLSSMPPALAPETRTALIEALKSDPNPAVRIKAVEALANLARSGGTLDNATVDMLRQKAGQNDENMYVRVKAAQALARISR